MLASFGRRERNSQIHRQRGFTDPTFHVDDTDDRHASLRLCLEITILMLRSRNDIEPLPPEPTLLGEGQWI